MIRFISFITSSLIFLLGFTSLVSAKNLNPDQIVAQLEQNLCADSSLNQSNTEANAVCIECLKLEREASGKIDAATIQASLKQQEQQKTELAFYKLLEQEGMGGDYGSGQWSESSLQHYIQAFEKEIKSIQDQKASMQRSIDLDKALEQGNTLSTTQKNEILQQLKKNRSNIQSEYKYVKKYKEYQYLLPKFENYMEKIQALEDWAKNEAKGKAPLTLNEINLAHPQGWGQDFQEALLSLSNQEKSYTLQKKDYEKKLKDLQQKNKSSPSPSTSTSEYQKYDERHKNILNKMRDSARRCGMSNAELLALNLYTGNAYRQVNSALRAGGDKAKNYEPYKQVLNSALAKLAPYKGEVNRGGDLPPSVLDLYQEGAIVESPAYTSTSIGEGFGANHRFVIKSKTGPYVGSYSMHYGEKEVLIRAGAKFKVLKRTDHGNGGIDFVLEEVE